MRFLTLICTFFSIASVAQVQLEKPVFSANSGQFNQSFLLELSHLEPGVEIYYTTNGNIPTQADNLYSGPIIINSRNGDQNVYSEIPTNPALNFPFGTYSALRANSRGWVPPYNEVYKINVIRAKAFKTGSFPSNIETKTYLIDPLANGKYSFPIVSFVADSVDLFSDQTGVYVYGNHPDGNYEQKGAVWERLGHVEIFDKNGDSELAQDLRFRIHGGGSRHSAKKKLRLYGEYGDNNNFNLDLFDNTTQSKFKRLLISAGGHRPDCFPRDDFANYLCDGLNFEQQNYKHVILFINGEYWGIHSIKERMDNYFFQNIYGINDDEITVLDQEFDLQGGGFQSDSIEMKNLETFVFNNDMNNPVNYDYVSDRVDIDNYIDYMSSEIFLSNVDWVYSNVVMWRKTGAFNETLPVGENGKFRWAMYDLDGGFGGSCNHAYYTVNTLNAATIETGTFASYTRFFRGMLSSIEFRNKFINRSCDLLNSHFKEDVVKQKLNDFYNLLTPEMMETVERWRYPSEADNLVDRYNEVPSLVQWDTVFHYLNIYADRRPRKIREHILLKWNLSDSSKITVDVNDQHMGRVKVNSLLIDENLVGVNSNVYPWNGLYIDSIPLPISAQPYPGYKFLYWQETGNTNPDLIWTPVGQDSIFTAVFGIDSTFQNIIINEVMLSNSNSISDNHGEEDDWIELYNPNATEVDLSGLYFTRDTSFSWTIPNGVTIQQDEYKIIWFDNQVFQGIDHSNFKLTNQTGQVNLELPNGDKIDSLIYPFTQTDYSFGRYPNASSSVTTFASPTPRMNNDFTSVKEEVLEELKMYPNPANHLVYFNRNIDFALFDVSGRLIGNYIQTNHFNVSGLTNGIYLVKTKNEVKRLVIKK